MALGLLVGAFEEDAGRGAAVDVDAGTDVLDAVEDVDVELDEDEVELAEGAFDNGWASRADTDEVFDGATVGSPAGASLVSLLAAIDVPTMAVPPRSVPAMTHPNARRRRRSWASCSRRSRS